MDVAVEAAVEGAELGADQDERRGYVSRPQEPMKIIHHPEKQQHSSAPNQARVIHQARWQRAQRCSLTLLTSGTTKELSLKRTTEEHNTTGEEEVCWLVFIRSKHISCLSIII